MQRIALIGPTGQIGSELARELQALGPVMPLGMELLDLSRPNEMAPVLDRVSPTVVVNAAAYTAVDRAEEQQELVFAINGDGPGTLARWCRDNGALLVHYSTDYVFDGSGTRPYLETDEPNPATVYGRSKLAGETAVLGTGCKALVLRTAWVYSWIGSNFLLTMLRLARERETLRIVGDQTGTPTWAREVARVTTRILGQALADPDGDHWGLYHLTAAGETTWFEFATRILALDPAREEQVCRKIEEITTGEYPTPAARPPYSVLDCTLVQRTFGVSMGDWANLLGEALAPGA